MGKKFGYRMLSILLSLVLVLELVPGSVWATGSDGTDISGIENNEMATNIEAAPGDTSKMVQGEVDELREESQKHFRMADGSYIAVDYGMPVHYALDAGSWAEIDNTLLLQSQETLPALLSNEMQPAEQGEVYACRNGDVTKAFAAVFVPDGTLVSAAKGEVGVAMSLLRDETAEDLLAKTNAASQPEPGGAQSEGAGVASMEEDEAAAASDENDQALGEENPPSQTEAAETDAPQARPMAAYVDAILLNEMQPFSFAEEDASLAAQVMPEKLSASVYYPDVYPGVDFQYDAVGQNIKESILINELQPFYRYDFLLQLEGLLPEMQEDGSIFLLDKAGEVSYSIPAPYMVDAAGAYSEAVFYELHPMADGYVLSVTADSRWIEESGRALPVVIDPALIATSKSLLDGVIARHVHEGSPNTPSNGANAYLGRGGSTAGNYHVYLYFKNLPTIPANCSVVNATVSLYQMNYDSIYNDSKFYGEIHEVTGAKPAGVTYTDWINTITWNKAPAYSSTVEDYVEFSHGSGHYADWDISRMVCQWYETAAENRLAVLTPRLVNGQAATAAFYTASNLQSHPPLFIVSYRNNVGLEEHYTYQTVSAGRAGTGYVGDYTSQLTLANSFAGSASNTLPFALTVYYNLANRNSYFTDSDSAGIHTVNYTKMNLGAGWKLSVQESVRKIAVTYRGETLNYYVYQDADGSEHYFQMTGSAPYQDEDGLGFSLTVSGSAITLKDKKDNKREFYNGYLTSIMDANGNAVHLLYNGKTYAAGSSAWKPAANTANYLSKIVRVNDNGSAADVVTTLFTLSYTTDGYLSNVADSAGRNTSFSYTAVGGMQRLTAITFPDGNSAQYAYDASGALTKAFDAESKTGLQFTYRIFFSTLCVEKVQEFASASMDGAQTIGGAWHLWVHSPYLKEYRFYGPDQTANTPDDTVARYTFDYTGKTVNIVNYDTNRTLILGVSNASYTPNSNTKTKNRVSGAASAGTVAKNLLSDSGFEKSTGWTLSASEVSSMVFAAARNSVPEASPAVKPHTGGYLLKTYVHTTKVSDTGAAFGGMYQRVYLQSGVSYTFSAWASSAGVTKYGKNGGLFLEFCNDSGSVLAASSPLDYKTTGEIAEGWTRLEVSYTPKASGWYRLCALQKNAGGYGAFDDLQLEETSSNVQESGASSANLVQLGSFEQPEGGNGTWWNTGSGSYVTENALSGYSLRLAGAAGETRRASQTISIQKGSDNTYVLSGWAKAYSVPNCPSTLKENNTDKQRFFGLIAKVEYTDGSAPDYHYVAFDCDYTDWQYASGMVVPKQKNKTVSAITVSTAYDYNENVCLFDEIALTEEPVQTYTYDEEGNLKAATSTKNSDSAYTYDGADLTKQIAGGYGTYTYDYDDHHNMTKATNDGVSVSATYDEAGNSTGTKLQKSDGTGSYLQTSATYTANQDCTASVTDANGGKSTFGYDALGRNTSVSTQVDTGVTSATNYTYETDTNRQHSARNSAGGVLYYGYTGGVQTDASRYAPNGQASDWQRYHVTADAWGNTTQIQVQGASGTTPTSWTEGLTLASYEYAGNNGYLDKMTYANGAYETYTYDRYGRVATIAHYSKAGVLSYTEVYLYDGNGNTGRCKILDRNGNLTEDYAYEYDSLGRLIRSSQKSGGETVLRTEHLYDLDNRLTRQSYQLGADTFTESYAYSDKDGSMTALTAANGDTLSFAYDGLKRLQTVTAPAYTKNYAYRNLSGSQTTTQTAALTYAGFANAPVWNYTYTANGNIKTQKKNGYAEAEYTYDSQGQLTGAYLSGKDLSYNYTYDEAGNLQKFTVHGMYHDNENAAYTYTYNNPDWADLLTAFNGDPIAYEGQTYDPETNTVIGTPTSGNPISYVHGGVRWSLAWRNGTQLASASHSEKMDNTKIAYSYDLNGLRTSKTITKEHYKMVLGCKVGFVADGVLVETITVAKGTTLQYADMPEVPEKPGYIGSWDYDGDTITKDTVILARYTENPITPGPGSGQEIMRSSIGGSTTEPMDMVRVLDYTTTEQHDYIYAGGRLLRETITETAKDKTVTTYTLDFAYDAQGTPYSITVTLSGIAQTYYYITNLQGDVMYLVDKTGKQVVSYDYDPYGKIIEANDSSTQTYAQLPTEPEDTTKTLAELNPLRYRGYYYDNDDVGFYYLQSRYYDASTCRFISADSYAITGLGLVGYNMFAYCNNEPINMFDGNGNVPQAVFDKLIHDEVLARICKQNDDLRYKDTCIYYNGKDSRNGWGFCDLYNSSTGEVWELKKNSTSRSCTTAAASKQLAKYIAGKLKHNIGLKLAYPYATNIQGDTFTKKTVDYTYYVRYWNEGGGILRYDYQKFDNSYDFNFDIMPATIAAITVACVYVAVAIFCPEALPPLLYGGGGGGMMVNMLY